MKRISCYTSSRTLWDFLKPKGTQHGFPWFQKVAVTTSKNLNLKAKIRTMATGSDGNGVRLKTFRQETAPPPLTSTPVAVRR